MKSFLPLLLALFLPFFLAHAGPEDNVRADNSNGSTDTTPAGGVPDPGQGNIEGKILISIPEPSAWVLFGAGLGVLVVLNVFSLKQRTRDFLEKEEKLRKEREN